MDIIGIDLTSELPLTDDEVDYLKSNRLTFIKNLLPVIEVIKQQKESGITVKKQLKNQF